MNIPGSSHRTGTCDKSRWQPYSPGFSPSCLSQYTCFHRINIPALFNTSNHLSCTPPTRCYSIQTHQATNLMVSPPHMCCETSHPLVILAELRSPVQIVCLDHSPRSGTVTATTFQFIHISRMPIDTTRCLTFDSTPWILLFPVIFLSPYSTFQPLILPDQFRSATSLEHMIVESLQWPDLVMPRIP